METAAAAAATTVSVVVVSFPGYNNIISLVVHITSYSMNSVVVGSVVTAVPVTVILRKNSTYC